MRRSKQLVWVVLFFFMMTFGADLHRAFACGGGCGSSGGGAPGVPGGGKARPKIPSPKGSLPRELLAGALTRDNPRFLLSSFAPYLPATDGEPYRSVMTRSGDLVLARVDGTLPGDIPLVMARVYCSSSSQVGSFNRRISTL